MHNGSGAMYNLTFMRAGNSGLFAFAYYSILLT